MIDDNKVSINPPVSNNHPSHYERWNGVSGHPMHTKDPIQGGWELLATFSYINTQKKCLRSYSTSIIITGVPVGEGELVGQLPSN